MSVLKEVLIRPTSPEITAVDQRHRPLVSTPLCLVLHLPPAEPEACCPRFPLKISFAAVLLGRVWPADIKLISIR